MAVLQVEKVSKWYGKHCALNEVSLEVPEKGIFGLLGPNGAGKTSLIRIINQITGPDSGRIFFRGEPLKPEHVNHIGYLPEERGLYRKMKVGEQCLYLARLKGLSSADAKARLKEWFERFEIGSWWDKKVEELSKGMAQKVQFITTVLHQPGFIILDEPFSGFDPINTNLIRKEIIRLKDEGASIMLSTHNMASVEEICSHIALINQSKVMLDGEIKEVRSRFKESIFELSFKGQMLSFTNALGTQFELLQHSSDADLRLARVKIKQGLTVNDLLQRAIPHVQIESVSEYIPSMNDIFIKVVEQPEEQMV